MKSAVQAELTIPAQTRYVFPIHLGKVERQVSSLSISLTAELICIFSFQVYDENLEKALLQLSLDARGGVHLAEQRGGHCPVAYLVEKASPNLHPSSGWAATKTRRQVLQARSPEEHEGSS